MFNVDATYASLNLILRKADATQEYFAKSAQWDREKKVRKARGLEWPCAACGLHFPGNGFIDDSRKHTSNQLANRDAIHEFCIAPGHWRCCRACAGLQLDGTTASKPDATTRECEKCKQHRPLQYFQESPSVCIACVLHEDFEIFPCGKCDKPVSMQHWSGRCDEYGQQLCTGCAPEGASLECYLCKKTLQCFSLKCPAVNIHLMNSR